MSTMTKRKAPAKLAAPYVKTTTKRPTKTTIDETRTSVSGTEALQTMMMETIEISSDADSDEDISDDNEEEEEEENEAAAQQQQEQDEAAQLNGENAPSARLVEKTQLNEEGEEEEEDATSPSFGELLRGNAGEAIDLTVMLRQPTTDAVIHTERTAIVPPTHQSLATVLSQALSTDDTDLLESCLNTTDLPTIKNTIERIDSSLAGILLHKLAARLHRRPGRAGTLMTWVQYTLVAHGGALASQAKVVHSLSGLQKVLADRAKGLTSLLALKGKLDILEGQMELRRRMQQQKSMDKKMMMKDEEEVEQNHGRGGGDDDEEEDVVYVEGEENDAAALTNGILSRRKPTQDADDALATNGAFNDDDDDDEEEDSDDAAGEDESDADAAEALDEDEVNYDDVDESMGEEEESDVEAAPPAKMQKVTKSFNKKK